MIEDPCSKPQGIFDRKEVCHFQIRSLTPQQAAGSALAFAAQRNEADVPEMLTEPGKWPDGDTSLLKGSSEMDIILYETNRLACGGARPEYRPNAGFL
jgi:hypothetical protein